MTAGDDLRAARGSISGEVAAEFPELRLFWLTLDGSVGPSPPALVRRLGELSNRFRGADVVGLRTQLVPRAHRAFFRQIGLDPDVDRVPIEAAAVRRLADGGFRSRGLLADALLVALIETGVGVWALDADLLAASGLAIRATHDGDRLGRGPQAPHLAPGRLVVADEETVHWVLFGRPAPGHAASERTVRLALFSIAVPGVPDLHAEEALWACHEALLSSRD